MVGALAADGEPDELIEEPEESDEPDDAANERRLDNRRFILASIPALLFKPTLLRKKKRDSFYLWVGDIGASLSELLLPSGDDIIPSAASLRLAAKQICE